MTFAVFLFLLKCKLTINTVNWKWNIETWLKSLAHRVARRYKAAVVSQSQTGLCVCVRSEGFMAVTEECRLLGYKNPVHTSQETHYVSVTDLSRLMLCMIWDFLSGDYKECCLLGYKNPVRTSQETHYASAAEFSWLMLCKIWGFQGGDCEERRLLEYKTQFVPHRRHITSLLQSLAG
jgi:hypothetical protein